MKILYLHNKEDWALHNVGKLWFLNLPDTHVVDIMDYHKITDHKKLFCGYDYVWFSYLYMYMKFNYDVNKSIVSIHDPMELFPQSLEWRTSGFLKENLEILRKLKYINTISTELQEILEKASVFPKLIPTTSLLPHIDFDKLLSKKLKILSIANDYPRKNFELMNKIKDFCFNNKIEFYLKQGDDILPEKEYINLIDNYSVYVCTSYQEGGPIPAMDAMMRGLLVLTTPVGQMNEIIENGINGFLCNTEGDFFDKINFLKNNKDCFLDMRKSSLNIIKKKRDNSLIKKQLASFLKTLKCHDKNI